ncbi:CPBP family intramembrane glutamic endopeptidase [Arsukibacterium sp.]|uniref:CPBP family intramembrane glutamic endopeptidase n=1 Tax=Arsukibacterium sp. TaxID=1977258 RepID=UPI00299F0F5E|nr:CPBP family intramembrane glutamic endopeptidase [Arsukibacterium sp.]MDX1676954.1 CPBP family intramembrane glutamic endopeptidase [Arsukibacterium sp.]
MKSVVYNANQPAQRAGLISWVAILTFLLMELPVRLWLQPDPWLLDAHHWYFNQPLRLLTEFGLVILLLAVIRCVYPPILQLPRSQNSLVLGAVLISALLFGLLEAEQLLKSFSAGLWWWLAWFCTGFCIGIGQELLYRGLLFTTLKRHLSLSVAATVTTVAFVIAPLHSVRLWHYIQQDEFIVVVILIGIYTGVSMFFQWLRNHTGSVIAPALVHGAGNAVTWAAVFA